MRSSGSAAGATANASTRSPAPPSSAVRAIACSPSPWLGFDLVQVAGLDPSPIDTAFTRRMLDRYKVGTTLSLGLDDSTDISSIDPERRKRGEARLMQVLSVARDIGATHVCGILYSAFQKYFEPPTSAGIAGSADVLRRIGEEAAKHGITIGLEVVNRYETNVLNTAAQAVAFARRVDM